MSDQPFLLAAAKSRIGEKFGVSDWVDIDQLQVNVFGEVTRWRTPGHCDPEYAAKGPYGGTIVHGFFMMSLITHFNRDVGLYPEDGVNPLNYGLDKVRVLKPVVIGDGVSIRSHITLSGVEEKGNGEYLLKTSQEFEARGVDGPVLYAEYLSYWFPKPV